MGFFIKRNTNVKVIKKTAELNSFSLLIGINSISLPSFGRKM